MKTSAHTFIMYTLNLIGLYVCHIHYLIQLIINDIIPWHNSSIIILIKQTTKYCDGYIVFAYSSGQNNVPTAD